MTAATATPSATGIARWRSGAPARNTMTNPVRPRSAPLLRFGWSSTRPATSPTKPSGGSSPRTNPCSAGGRGLRTHPRTTVPGGRTALEPPRREHHRGEARDVGGLEREEADLEPARGALGDVPDPDHH